MKFLVILALISAVSAAHQTRAVFHEHFEDFVDLIDNTVGDEIAAIFGQYAQFEEFTATFEYMNTANFRQLVQDMEYLPEFRAMVDFLETHSIDITYFIDRFNSFLDIEDVRRSMKSRQSISGRDFNSFTRDTMAVFPRDQLASLFDQKFAEDDDFRAAIEGLQSDDWDYIFNALWANDEFLTEIQILETNGIDVAVLLDQLLAIFGQN